MTIISTKSYIRLLWIPTEAVLVLYPPIDSLIDYRADPDLRHEKQKFTDGIGKSPE